LYYCRWPQDAPGTDQSSNRFDVFIPEATQGQNDEQTEGGAGSSKRWRKSTGSTKGALFYAYNHQVHEAVGSLRRVDPSQPIYKAMPVTYMGKTTNMDVQAANWLAPVGTPLFYCHGRTPFYNNVFFMWWDECFAHTFRNTLPVFSVKSGRQLRALLDLSLTW
jgi:hypothetical protein